MASTSYKNLEREEIRRGSPVVSFTPRIMKTEVASCEDLTKLQPSQHYQKGHVRSSSTSPNPSIVRFRKKKTLKKPSETRPKSLVVMNSMSMRKNSSVPENGLPLTEALNDKKVKVGFRIFLESEFSVENLDFWIAAEEYRKIKNNEARRERMREIYEEYISPGALNQINLDHFTRQQIIQHMATDTTSSIDTFTGAQRYVFNIMENDSYARFVRSKYYDLCSSPGRRSPRQFLHDILHSGKSRDRSPSPNRKGTTAKYTAININNCNNIDTSLRECSYTISFPIYENENQNDSTFKYCSANLSNRVPKRRFFCACLPIDQDI
uniref:regulator of G-protein signaling 2-like isoform X1 n=2 Tax=Styela clava TaxID=7725 RepID=UPI001939FE03|nr:regulator of G-protein signaling 2-like isoform X1 [Styela clava]